MRLNLNQEFRIIVGAVLLSLSLCACSGRGLSPVQDAAKDTQDAAKDDNEQTNEIWGEWETVRKASADEIDSIRFTIYTEGGALSTTVTDSETMEEICSYICDLSLGEESQMGASDNGLYMEVIINDEELVFNFEADIAVMENDMRYEVKNLGMLRNYLESLLVEKGDTE